MFNYRSLAIVLLLFALVLFSCPVFAATYTGKVVDSVGKPIAGASVAVHIYDNISGASRVANLISESDGGFNFDAADEAKAEMPYNCWISAPGYAYGGGTIQMDKLNTFTLQSPVDYKGSFVDQDGKPVVGKKVSLQLIAIGSTWFFPQADPLSETSPISTLTDQKGHFTFLSIPSASTISMSIEGNISSYKVIMPGDGKPLVVQPAINLTGHVTHSDNSPAPNLTIIVSNGSGFTHTTTAKDGSYTIGGLSQGEYRIEVVNSLNELVGETATITDWALPISVMVTIKPNMPAVTRDFVLHHGALISGTVSDAVTGQPITDARIGAVNLDAAQAGADTSEPTINDQSVRTDKDGHYVLRTRPGTLITTVSTLPGDYAPQDYADMKQLYTVEGGTYTADIKLKPGLGAKLHIVDQDGKIPPKLDLNVAPDDPGQQWGVTNTKIPDVDGFYEVHNAKAGKYDLHLPGSWKIVSGGTFTIPAKSPIEVALSKIPTLTIASRVINPDGDPVPGVILKFTIKSSNSHLGIPRRDVLVTSDDHGRFELPDINPDDKVTVVLAKADYALLSGGSITINNSDAVMSPPIMTVADRNLIGVVKDINGKPLPDAYVIATIGGPDLPIKTDSTGHFKMSGLPRTSFDLIAAKSTRRGKITITPNTVISTAKIILSDDNSPPKSEDTPKYFAIMEKLIPRANPNVDNITWNSIMTDLAPYHPDLGLREIDDHGQTNMYTYFSACCRAIAVDPLMGAKVVKRLYPKITDPSLQYFACSRAALAVGHINPELGLDLYNVCKPEANTDIRLDGVDTIALAYLLRQPDADSLYQAFAAKELKAENATPNQPRVALVSYIDEIAVGDWKKAKQLVDALPGIEKVNHQFDVRAMIDFDPDEAVDAFRSNYGLSTLTYQSTVDSNTQQRLAGVYAKQNPKAALDFARTFPDGRTKADALLAVADQTALPDAKTIYQEAFSEVIGNDTRSTGARIACHAWQRDHQVGLALFEREKETLVAGQINLQTDTDGMGFDFPLFDEFVWYIAQADPGYARVLIEKQKANRALQPTSTTEPLPGSNNSNTPSYGDTDALQIAADAIAMSALSTDDALAMAENIPDTEQRNQAIYRIAEYAAASDTVRAKMNFNVWASGLVDFAGAEYGRFY